MNNFTNNEKALFNAILASDNIENLYKLTGIGVCSLKSLFNKYLRGFGVKNVEYDLLKEMLAEQNPEIKRVLTYKFDKEILEKILHGCDFEDFAKLLHMSEFSAKSLLALVLRGLNCADPEYELLKRIISRKTEENSEL